MHICLIYFSGTGATANLADIFKKHLIKIGYEVDLIRIKHDTQFDLRNYDVFGIGTPVYSYRAPRMVTRILKNLDFQKKPFFIFSTTGGQKGNTHWNIYQAVRETGGSCLGEFTVSITTNIRSWMPIKRRVMPHYSISDHDENRTLAFIHEILGNKEYDRTIQLKHNIFLSIYTSLLSWRWEMALIAGFKQVDKMKCTKCGLCARDICPSGAIILGPEGYPEISERICVGCNGCVNLCPVDAIWAWKSKNHHQYKAFMKYIINFPNQSK